MIFSDPNVVYLLLLLGLWSSVFGLYIPGTGVLEVLALLTVIGSLLALAVNPATNWLAAILIGVGVLGYMFIPLYRRAWARFAGLGLVAQAVGGLFLFNATTSASVSPLFVTFTVGLSFLFYKFVLLPFAEKQSHQPVLGDEELLPGAFGTVVKALDPVGTVNVRSELWTAYADEPIAAGEHIMVISKEGLRLFVEKAKHKRRPLQVQQENSNGSDLGLPESGNLTEAEEAR